jgi:hypothetical protein
MDREFGTWNVWSLYRADNLMTVLRECRRSDGWAVAPNLPENTHFSMERGMRIMN